MVDVPELPWLTLRLFDEADSVKLGACTDTASEVVTVKSPEVPVIVNEVVADKADLLAVSVNTLVPVVGFVPHDADTPVGSVEVTARLTRPVNPPASVTVMVVDPDEPWLTDKVPDRASSQKPGVCGPASASIRFCPFALPQPVTRS
jgi:hypothetical protein